MAEQAPEQAVTTAGRYRQIPLGNKPYASAYQSVGKEICRNLYMENTPSGFSKAPYYFLKVPGLKRWIDSDNGNLCRGIYATASGRIFYACGTSLYEASIPTQGGPAVRTYRGDILSFSGRVNFADNGDWLLFVDGQNGYQYDLNTDVLSVIGADGNDQSFPNGTEHITCIDTYFICAEPNTDTYYWSNPGYELNPESLFPNDRWIATNSGKKIAYPDSIKAVCQCNNMLWLFGSSSIECHYDTGDTTGQLWARYTGAIIEIGCIAQQSPARYLNNVYWIGGDAKTGSIGIFTNEGFLPKRISTRGIEQIMSGFMSIEDAFGFVYSQNGHAFYVLQFPTDQRTLVYDMVTDCWHERSRLDPDTGVSSCWQGAGFAFYRSLFVAGDLKSNGLFTIDADHFVNDDLRTATGHTQIQCEKTTPILFSNGVQQRIHEIQILASQGVGLPADDDRDTGRDPVLLVSMSRDFGNRWGNERAIPLGKIGEYAKRSRSLAWGMGRNILFRIRFTDPTEFILVGFVVNASPMER